MIGRWAIGAATLLLLLGVVIFVGSCQQRATRAPDWATAKFWSVAKGEVSLDEALTAYRAGEFQALPALRRFEGIDHEVWGRWMLRNDDEQTVAAVLEMAGTFDDEMTLYLLDSSGFLLQRQRTGENVPYAEKPIGGRYPTFLVQLPPRSEVVVLIRFRSTAWVQVGFREWRPATLYFAYAEWRNLGSGVHFGILLALVVYNVFVYIGLRYRAILTYLYYLVSFAAAFWLYGNYYLEGLPWLRSPWSGYPLSALACILPHALIAFSIDFLEPGDRHPWVTRIWRWLGRASLAYAGLLVVVGIGLAAVGFTGWNGGLEWLLNGSALFMFLCIVLLPIGALFMMNDEGHQPQLYLLAFAAVFLVMLLPTLGLLNIRLLDFEDLAVIQLGSAANWLLFAVALADKLAVLQREKDQALAKAESEQKQRLGLETENSKMRRAKEWSEKLAEEAWRSNQELEATNRRLKTLYEQKREFLGIAAHDLKNPLGVIRGLAQVMLEQSRSPLGDRLPPQSRMEMLAAIEESTKRMLNTLDELLNAESLDEGNINLRRQWVDVGDLVANVVALNLVNSARKGITIQLEAETGVIAYADRERLREVIDNLVSNAVKYTPPGKAAHVAVDYLDDNREWVVLGIRDEGPGFSEEDLPKLFGRFQKLSARPTGGESSSGLGLAIVKKLVELHGGRIELVSKVGEGAYFKIYLPSKRPA